MKTSKEAIDKFLSQKNFAVVGVSRSGNKFGNSVFNEMKKKGFNVYAVHPCADEIGGEKCYANFNDLPQKADAVILSVKPTETEKIVNDAAANKINNVWMLYGSQSETAVNFCRQNGMNVIYNECILMHAQPVDSIHKIHRFVWNILGKLPK